MVSRSCKLPDIPAGARDLGERSVLVDVRQHQLDKLALYRGKYLRLVRYRIVGEQLRKHAGVGDEVVVGE